MTRPVRQIVGEGLCFKYLSITEDENRLMVRILVPVPNDMAHSDVSDQDFFSTKVLLHRYIKQDNVLFFVQAEGCFDRTSDLGRKWWESGANIEFITDSYLANQGIISVVSKHRCYPNSLERSTDWLRRLGKQGLCQIYCRTQNESIVNAAKSFTTDIEGRTYTNIDKKRLVIMSTDELNSNPLASSFLITHPIIQIPDFVNPYEPFAGRITLFRGEDKQVATECNGDFWMVEALSGYIPNRIVKIVNGIGYFWARALDLEDGDVMEIRVADMAGHIFNSVKAIVKDGDEKDE